MIDDEGYFTKGKHEGAHVSDVSVNYIMWCLDNLDNLNPKARELLEYEASLRDPDVDFDVGAYG